MYLPTAINNDRQGQSDIYTTIITPPGYASGMEGVYLIKPNGKQLRILDIPLWVSQLVVSGDQDEADAQVTLEWLNPRGQHRSGAIPLTKIGIDPRATCKWLLSHGVIGLNIRRPSEMSNYLRESVRAWQEKIRDSGRETSLVLRSSSMLRNDA